MAEAASERKARAEEIQAAETKALEDREAKRESESEARLKDWADAVAKAGAELEARIEDMEPVEAKVEVEGGSRVKEIETDQSKTVSEREANVKEWTDAAAKVRADLTTPTNDKEDNWDGIKSTVVAGNSSSETAATVATDYDNSPSEESVGNADKGRSSGNNENIPAEAQERTDEMRERSSQR